MGRWDFDVYDSDGTLDFFAIEIADQIEREMAYYMSPMRYITPEEWLGQVLTIIEVILLFDKHNIGSAVFLWEREPLIYHWRQSIFAVWDATWNNAEPRLPYGQYDYRQKNRNILMIMFERLDEIVAGFLDDDEPNALTKLSEDDQPPYFSTYEETDKKGITHVYPAGYCVGTLIDKLKKMMVYTLSHENSSNVINMFEIEYIWVCVDIIGFLCETYMISPRITVNVIDRWEKRMFDLWVIRTNDEPRGWGMDKYLPTIDRIFNRLRRVANQYPSRYDNLE